MMSNDCDIEDIDLMAPDTNAPKMEVVKFAVPKPLLEEALALAEAEGWKPAELFRVFWERGFAAYAEGSNKRLVNRGLREKQEKKEDADSLTALKYLHKPDQ